MENRLLPVASGQHIENGVTFHTDATIYRCNLETGKEVNHPVDAGRGIFIYLTRGEILVNGEMLMAEDQARIDIDEPLTLSSQQDSEFILIDLPL